MSNPNFQANGTISVSTFVKIDTTANDKVVQAGAGDFVIGVAQDHAKYAPIPGAGTEAADAGDPIQVHGIGKVCLLTATTAGWTAGDRLKSNASGAGVTASAGDYYGAIALETVSGATPGRVVVTLGKN